MSDRGAVISAFLARVGWGQSRRSPLAGDASQRRYERLVMAGRQAVLMDAPPERGENVRPFIRVGRLLNGWGLSAPTIMAEDPAAGLLLIEDLGDDLYARQMAADPSCEGGLYAAAVDTLVEIHRHHPPEAPRYGPDEMVVAARLAYDWYLGGLGRKGDAEAFTRDLHALLSREVPATTALVLRDFHAENLIWLPERRGVARVGLLDFQDAAAGHPAYDLASLVTDIRREVSPRTRQELEDRYAQRAGRDADRLRAEVALLSVQRSLRIIGTFSRLWIRDGKPRYLDFLPRMWELLRHDLAHPVAAPIVRRVLADLPPPDPETLEQLAQCRTIPAL